MANIAPIRTSAEIATIINKAQHALADLGWQIVNEEKQGITVQDVYHRDKVYQLLLIDVMLKNILDENGNVIQYYQASANEEKFNNILSGLLDLSKDFDGPAIPMLVARNSTLVFYPSVQSSTGVPSGGPATPGGTTFQNLSVNSPGATLDSFSSNQSQFVFYIVAVRSAAGAARTSIMSGSWVGSNTPVYTETRTEDVGGSTSDLVLKIELSGGNIQLNAYTTTTGWSVQGLRILFQNISFSNALGPLPAGGTTNQLLKKNSNNDYDVSWFTLTVAALTDLMATVTELNYSQGLTSNIQTQINAIISTIANAVLTASEGLTKVGTDVRLGGIVTGGTLVSISSVEGNGLLISMFDATNHGGYFQIGPGFSLLKQNSSTNANTFGFRITDSAITFEYPINTVLVKIDGVNNLLSLNLPVDMGGQSLTNLPTAVNPSDAVRFDQVPILPSNANGVLKNDGSGTLSWITDFSSFNGLWTTVSTTSPWVTQGRSLQYKTDALGFIHLRGQLWTSGTALTSFTLTIATLPIGARPTQDCSYPIEYYDGTNRRSNTITISSTGTITIANGYSSPASDVYFEQIIFSKN